MSDTRPFYLRWFTKTRLTMVIGISLAIHFLIGIFFGGVVIFDLLNAPEPQLESPPIPESIDPMKREYKIKMKRSQQQSAAPLPIPIIAEIPSNLSLENIDLNLSNPRSDVRIRGAGDGDGTGKGFGDGFADGSGFELDIKIDFFGISGGGKNIVFVIDLSDSLAESGKEKIMRAEASRVLEELPVEVNFGLIFFAGPSWPGMDDVRGSADNWVSSPLRNSPNSDPGSFRPKKWSKLPNARYYSADSAARKRAIKAVRETPTLFGTIFDVPMFMALSMNPTPDTIFFMTDGQCPEERGITQIRRMVNQLKQQGKNVPVIHTVGLGIAANSHLDQIARLGKGESRYVTPQEYQQKYGNSNIAPTKDPRFETSQVIPQVPSNDYPIEFEIK